MALDSYKSLGHYLQVCPVFVHLTHLRVSLLSMRSISCVNTYSLVFSLKSVSSPSLITRMILMLIGFSSLHAVLNLTSRL